MTHDSGADLQKNGAGGNDEPESAAGRLFDLRELIAGLFLLFGIILVITGIFDSQAEIDKAAGVHINLYTGIGMILTAAVFVAWRLWRPLRRENLAPADDDTGGAPQDPIAGH